MSQSPAPELKLNIQTFIGLGFMDMKVCTCTTYKPEDTLSIKMLPGITIYSGSIENIRKTLEISAEPIEVTMECDYKTITVSDVGHRLYIIGINNQIILKGNGHSVEFEGFGNKVLLQSDISGAQMCINGKELSHTVDANNNNTSHTTEGPRPVKLEFPSDFKDDQRRRFVWRPVGSIKTFGGM